MQPLLNQEEMVHLLGTIFSGGLIHMWYSSVIFWQQDGVLTWLKLYFLFCISVRVRLFQLGVFIMTKYQLHKTGSYEA